MEITLRIRKLVRSPAGPPGGLQLTASGGEVRDSDVGRRGGGRQQFGEGSSPPLRRTASVGYETVSFFWDREERGCDPPSQQKLIFNSKFPSEH